MATRDRVTSAFAPDLEELRAWLQTMLAALRFAEIIVAVIGLIGRMRDINTQLVSQLAHLRRRHPRSETLGRLGRQLVLPLAGIVPSALPHSNNPSGAEPKKSRKGRHPERAMPPAHLPRIPVFNRVPPELRVCPQCGATMTTVGHSSCLVLNVIPARVVVEQRLDETVACPNDDTIVSASPPPQIVERGKLADALTVEAVCDKYLDHLPIERQCTRFARAGVEVAPQTLGRSVGAAIDLLAPVARLIEEQTRAPGLLGTDATGLPVLEPTVTEGIRNGTMWCWTNARWVTFFYSAKGDSDSVRRFLGDDLARTVQCDGTSITTFLERAGGQRPGCWATRAAGLLRQRAPAIAWLSRACASSRASSPSSASRPARVTRPSSDASDASAAHSRSSTSSAPGWIGSVPSLHPRHHSGRGSGTWTANGDACSSSWATAISKRRTTGASASCDD
jgi:transposase